MFPGRRRGRQGGNFGVMLLFFQMMNFGFDRIPPVTLVTIALQVAIFLGLGDLTRFFPSTYDVCISTHMVVKQQQWRRLILGTLFHASDMHLYFNMVSMLWKGSMLERKFRSAYFAYLLAVFTVLTSLTYVAINHVLGEVLSRTYSLECGVGFSGVLFALKVLTTHYTPAGRHYVMGFIPVPSKYIYWAELGIIQLIHPNASFTGHLAGIFVGLIYIKGPLKVLMDSFMPAEPSYTYSQGTSSWTHTQGHTTGGRHQTRYEDSGRRGPTEDEDRYQQYTGGLSEEEQIRQAMEESRRYNTRSSTRGERLYPDLDELRQRRADRYT